MGRTTAVSVGTSTLNVDREIGYHECEFSWLFQKL